MAPLGRPATTAASRLMVVRRPILAAATGAARSSLSAPPCANGAVGRARAIGLSQPERLPRMAEPLAVPMLAQKRRLEALGCVPQPFPRPPPQRPPPERAIVVRVVVRATVPPSQPSGFLVIPAPPRSSSPGAEEEDQVITDPSVLAALEHAYNARHALKLELPASRGVHFEDRARTRAEHAAELFVPFTHCRDRPLGWG
eukprot:scaffold25535_cov143-Isochrysis_galbana.AAC.2